MTEWGPPGGDRHDLYPVYTGPPPSGQFPDGRYPVALNAYPPPPNPYARPGVYTGPGAWSRPRRPGLVTAAAVLAHITGGLLIIAATVLATGGTVASDWDDASGQGSVSPALWTCAVLNLFSAGLLIAGAVGLTSRRPTGRTLVAFGGVATLLQAFYWLIDWSGRAGNGVTVWAVLFGTLAVLAAAFAVSPTVSAWLRSS